MYLSYYKRPELMLLEEDSCKNFKKETYIEQFFYHILYTNAAVYYSGEAEEEDKDTIKRDRESVREILTGWVRSNYFSKLQLKTYYISKTFFQALTKTFDKIAPLMNKEGLVESLHEDCCLIWNDTTYFLWRDPEDEKCHYLLSICNGAVVSFSSFTFDKYGAWESHTISFMHLNDYHDDDRSFIDSVYSFLLFKKYGNVEIEFIAKKKTLRKSQILGEKVNNFMGIDVQVLDSRWFTTICRDEGFLVSGHFRLQPYKDEQGDWTCKLIYINPYAKHGYHRLAPIVNINN